MPEALTIEINHSLSDCTFSLSDSVLRASPVILSPPSLSSCSGCLPCSAARSSHFLKHMFPLLPQAAVLWVSAHTSAHPMHSVNRWVHGLLSSEDTGIRLREAASGQWGLNALSSQCRITVALCLNFRLGLGFVHGVYTSCCVFMGSSYLLRPSKAEADLIFVFLKPCSLKWNSLILV